MESRGLSMSVTPLAPTSRNQSTRALERERSDAGLGVHPYASATPSPITPSAGNVLNNNGVNDSQAGFAARITSNSPLPPLPAEERERGFPSGAMGLQSGSNVAIAPGNGIPNNASALGIGGGTGVGMNGMGYGLGNGSGRLTPTSQQPHLTREAMSRRGTMERGGLGGGVGYGAQQVHRADIEDGGRERGRGGFLSVLCCRA